MPRIYHELLSLLPILIQLAQFIEGDLQRVHLAEELGELLGEEGTLAFLGDAAHGSLGHEVAEATLIVDDFERLQVVEGTYHSVGIHLHHRGIFAHRGDAVVLAVDAYTITFLPPGRFL